MGQKERNFVVTQMYPRWVKVGMSDKASTSFYDKAYKMGLDVTVVDAEFDKMIQYQTRIDNPSKAFEAYKQSKLQTEVSEISAEVFAEDYGMTSAKKVDTGTLLKNIDDEISGKESATRGAGSSSTSGT